MLAYVKFLNPWHRSLYWKHHIWKNYKTQFSTNHIEWWNCKKILIIQKDQKQKITLKRMRIKSEIKNKLEDNYKFLIEGWWKEKSI
jgi:hypothetical protein